MVPKILINLNIKNIIVCKVSIVKDIKMVKAKYTYINKYGFKLFDARLYLCKLF